MTKKNFTGTWWQELKKISFEYKLNCIIINIIRPYRMGPTTIPRSFVVLHFYTYSLISITQSDYKVTVNSPFEHLSVPFA